MAQRRRRELREARRWNNGWILLVRQRDEIRQQDNSSRKRILASCDNIRYAKHDRRWLYASKRELAVEELVLHIAFFDKHKHTAMVPQWHRPNTRHESRAVHCTSVRMMETENAE